MRLQGWESRLADYLNGERKKAFVWGENDCILFAARAADCVVDRDLTQEIEGYGRYNEARAHEILDEYGGEIEGIFDRHFDRRDNMLLAQRGDIATVKFGAMKAAGIIDTTGRLVACKTKTGLIHVPISHAITVWEVV